MVKEIFVSPVKPKQTVYIVGGKHVKEYEVKEVYFNEYGGGFSLNIGNYSFDAIDESVFLSEHKAQIKCNEVWGNE